MLEHISGHKVSTGIARLWADRVYDFTPTIPMDVAREAERARFHRVSFHMLFPCANGKNYDFSSVPAGEERGIQKDDNPTA